MADDELPFVHMDEGVQVEVRADTYPYGSTGVGIQLMLEGRAHMVAARLPREPAIRFAVAILAALDDDPEHIIDLRADGWTIKHPLACRPDLFACPVNRAAERDLTEQPAMPAGQYRCLVGADGAFVVIEPEVLTRG